MFTTLESLTEQLAAVPELANLGNLFKSSSLPAELTESETEYVVRCVKHVFSRHIVFQVGKRCTQYKIRYLTGVL